MESRWKEEPSFARASSATRPRVKLRLRWVTYGIYVVSLVLMFLSVPLVILLVVTLRNAVDVLRGRWLWEPVVSVVLPLTVCYVTLLLLKIVAVKRGWMTKEEARSFPLRKSQWPDSWLELPPNSGTKTGSMKSARHVGLVALILGTMSCGVGITGLACNLPHLSFLTFFWCGTILIGFGITMVIFGGRKRG
jgi:hypothetical protein